MRSFRFFLCFQFIFIIAAAQQPRTLRIDPDFATGMPVSQVFEEVNFIPLETTRESLFGTINQLGISDQYFIILDRSTNAILIFQKDGKYHTKISMKGLNVYSFEYEKDHDRIRVYSTNDKDLGRQLRERAESDVADAVRLMRRFFKVEYFDLNGKSLKIPATKKSLTLENLSSITLPGDYMFSNFAIADEGMKEESFELKLYKNGELYQSYFPYTHNKESARYGLYLRNPSGFSVSQFDTVLYFTRPLDYSIYELSPHSFNERFQIVFPMKNTFPQTFITDKMTGNDRRNFLRDNPALITGISNIHERGNRLFFKINNSAQRRSGTTSILYDLKTDQVISINKMSPDSSSYFLPVFDFAFSNESFKVADANYLYSYTSSLRMFQAIEENATKGITYPLSLDQYIKTGNKKDNPVIVQLKPILNH
ncbi:MAG: 6-bladed beta-propeller [Ginsengibacter sp.]